MSVESVMPSHHLILCHPLLLVSTIPPSIIVFSIESTLHMRWPKYWRFSFSIIPSKADLLQNGLVDLLAVQGTLRSLLQHHSSKASILRHSAFFTVQLSHPYMTTGKTKALTRQTFVGKAKGNGQISHFTLMHTSTFCFSNRNYNFLSDKSSAYTLLGLRKQYSH